MTALNGSQLLKVLNKAVCLRDQPGRNANYDQYFLEATCYVLAKILQEYEFIPIGLVARCMGITSHKCEIFLTGFFEASTPSQTIDRQLSIFYKNHNLKRNINFLDQEIRYFFKPKAPSADHSIPFFDYQQIKNLIEYHGTGYMTSDPHLKQIGTLFAKFLVAPTNYWSSKLNLPGFQVEKEKYWQVVGLFKSFTRARLYRPADLGKKVFFSIGINLKDETLYWNLDCLRSGSYKMGPEQIKKFDYFLTETGAEQSLPLSKLNYLDWDNLIHKSWNFFLKRIPYYDGVIDYLYRDKINLKILTNKIIPVKSKTYLLSHKMGSEKGTSKGKLLVSSYEKFMLRYIGKNELANKVKILDHASDFYDVLSFHPNGNKKWIMVRITSGSSQTGFSVTRRDLEWEDSKKEPYLYLIFNYRKASNSGLLYIKKGLIKDLVKLKPVVFEAILK